MPEEEIRRSPVDAVQLIDQWAADHGIAPEDFTPGNLDDALWSIQLDNENRQPDA